MLLNSVRTSAEDKGGQGKGGRIPEVVRNDAHNQATRRQTRRSPRTNRRTEGGHSCPSFFDFGRAATADRSNSSRCVAAPATILRGLS